MLEATKLKCKNDFHFSCSPPSFAIVCDSFFKDVLRFIFHIHVSNVEETIYLLSEILSHNS